MDRDAVTHQLSSGKLENLTAVFKSHIIILFRSKPFESKNIRCNSSDAAKCKQNGLFADGTYILHAIPLDTIGALRNVVNIPVGDEGAKFGFVNFKLALGCRRLFRTPLAPIAR